jgi:hypothetical protein
MSDEMVFTIIAVIHILVYAQVHTRHHTPKFAQICIRLKEIVVLPTIVLSRQ